MRESSITTNGLLNQFFTVSLAAAVAASLTACTDQTANQTAKQPANQAVNQPVATPQDSHANQNASAANKEMVLKPEVPSAITAEHKELHEQLETAIKSGGKTGEAAKVVEERLKVHFEKEEQYALPQLGLLSHLAMNHLSDDMKKAIELSDKLKAELPKMLEEHQGIVEALDALEKAGKEENKLQAVEFAEKLKAHALNEEQVMYPAAILVGEYLKLKFPK